MTQDTSLYNYYILVSQLWLCKSEDLYSIKPHFPQISYVNFYTDHILSSAKSEQRILLICLNQSPLFCPWENNSFWMGWLGTCASCSGSVDWKGIIMILWVRKFRMKDICLKRGRHWKSCFSSPMSYFWRITVKHSSFLQEVIIYGQKKCTQQFELFSGAKPPSHLAFLHFSSKQIIFSLCIFKI